MADLNITRTDNIHAWEDVWQNPVPNGYFDNQPAFTAATTATTSGVWIDGTASGSSTNDIYNWKCILQSGGAATWRFDDSEGHSGTTSLKVVVTTGIGSTNSNEASLLGGSGPSAANQNRYLIPVYPSAAYIFTGWIKTSSITAGSGGARFKITEYDGVNTAATATRNTTLVTGTNDWTQYTSSFTTNANTKLINLFCDLTLETGTAWYDDISLVKVAPSGQVTLPITPIVTPGIQDISGPKIWG